MDLKNYKVIIISPLDEINNLSDGSIQFLGDRNDYLSHSRLMIRYGLDTYGENSVFSLIRDGYYLPVYPAFFLTEYGNNVVFLNISSDKVGKAGLLYLPSDLSDEQINSVNKLSRILKGFNIEINMDLKLDDGIVESVQSNLHCDGKMDIIYTAKKKSKRFWFFC